ncbi:STAS-like domain-containing protein [Sulfobacillus sp. hq2]|uniref:STAS-like domain-containing protein n=2 Tax=Sulfobacillus TaxID=28033 RepID=UPI000CD1B6CD|nr:STAS-like domain-containing protein [Sulfobacillus sp. hq2]POB11818.1 hypothetical protein CO251_03005 [Sulfobacillus sp. hq2]
MAVAIASGGQVFSLNVKEWMSTDLLGSREQGRKLRQLLVDSVEQQQTIHLDFRGIDVMTSAFADECFGKLWDIKPHHILKQMIRISGLTGNNKTVFRFVLQHRD